MKAKHIIGIILYSLEALFFLLILIGSPSAMSIIDAAMAGNHSDNPAVNAAYTLLKTALVAILIYGLFGIVFAIIGIIFSAKKKSGNSILNILALLLTGYSIVLTVSGVATISLANDLGSEAVNMPLVYVRLALIAISGVLPIVSMFMDYATSRAAKCSTLIVGSALTLVLMLTGETTNSSASLIFLLVIGQLTLAILYLVSKDEDAFQNAPVNNLGKESAADALTALTELQEDLNSGRISDAEFDELRKQYIDKL